MEEVQIPVRELSTIQGAQVITPQVVLIIRTPYAIQLLVSQFISLLVHLAYTPVFYAGEMN
jgi:hypothetical protein